MIPKEVYHTIRTSIPIPCVDLLISDPINRILLVWRVNQPAAEQWWFPGGRVHFGELRLDAAKRKLYEECGLQSTSYAEIGTYDILLSLPEGSLSHGITTLFHVEVTSTKLALDDQSSAGLWKHSYEWLTAELHPFIRDGIQHL